MEQRTIALLEECENPRLSNDRESREANPKGKGEGGREGKGKMPSRPQEEWSPFSLIEQKSDKIMTQGSYISWLPGEFLCTHGAF